MAPSYITVSQLTSRPKAPGRWPISQATFWRQAKAGLLPTPVKFGGLGTLPVGDYYAIALDHADPTGWQDPEYLENLIRQASTVRIGAGETRTLELKLFATP